MLGFLLGAAAITTPQYGIPSVAAVAAVKGARSLGRKLKKRKQTSPGVVGALADSKSGDQAAEDTQDDWEEWAVLDRQVDPVTLQWTNLQCTLTTKGGHHKTILKNVSGQARPGRLLALMGPSGSGKTTLLNALAGQLPLNGKMSLLGLLTVNGKPAGDSNHRQGFVQQEDVFYSQLTVAETMTMAAELRLPSAMPADAKAHYVERLVSVLGLAKALDTVVGDEKQRGLSGGEKKRLSIGCELIGSPSLIFLDEPTTGLDAFAAQKVIETLKQLAVNAGHTVVCSIHQPRSSIFTMFDDLLLLSEGEVVYFGPANQAVAHFSLLGLPCPPAFNPAEFLADTISIDYSSKETEEASRARLRKLADAWREHSSRQQPTPNAAAATAATADGPVPGKHHPSDPKVGWLQQFRLLATRSWRQVTRDRATNFARAMANLSSALLFGAIYFRMKRSQSSIQDRLGLLQVAAINTAMSSLVKTLNVFPKERVIVTRERAKQSYQTAPYLAGKLLAELPVGAVFPLLFGTLVYPLTGLQRSPLRFARFLGILTLESFASSALGLSVGAFAPSTEAAVAIGPAVMVAFIVFGGFYVNADNVPRPLRWLPRASLIKQGFEALCLNEFPGIKFNPNENGGGMTTGEQVLKWLSFDRTTIPGSLLSQGRILAFYYWTTYCILKANRAKFLKMSPPEGLAGSSIPTAAAAATTK